MERLRREAPHRWVTWGWLGDAQNSAGVAGGAAGAGRSPAARPGEEGNWTDLLNAARSSGKCQEKCQKKRLASSPPFASWERGFFRASAAGAGGGTRWGCRAGRLRVGSGSPWAAGAGDAGESVLGTTAGAVLVLSCTPGRRAGLSRWVLHWELELRCSSGLTLQAGGQRHPLEEAAGSPKNRVSRASTLASGRRRMDLSAQPPPSSSSQKGKRL